MFSAGEKNFRLNFIVKAAPYSVFGCSLLREAMSGRSVWSCVKHACLRCRSGVNPQIARPAILGWTVHESHSVTITLVEVLSVII